jgi:WD40 repeat protein
VAFNGEKALTGTASGQLLTWSPEGVCQNANAPPLHQGVLESLCLTDSHLFTGGRDLVVNILDLTTHSVIFSFSLAEFGSVNGQPRAIDLDPTGTSLVIGTFGCEIYQVPLAPDRLSIGEPKPLIQGHHAPKVKDTNEVWGLCSVPGTDRFITVSDDATLRVWSAKTKELVALVDLNRHQDRRPLPPDPQTKELARAA